METSKAKVIDDSRWVVILKTFGTICLLGSWGIAALGYLPYNLPIEVIGCVCWMVVGFRWTDKNLIVMNGIIALFAFIAMFTN